jgi:hypothetical protein
VRTRGLKDDSIVIRYTRIFTAQRKADCSQAFLGWDRVSFNYIKRHTMQSGQNSWVCILEGVGWRKETDTKGCFVRLYVKSTSA